MDLNENLKSRILEAIRRDERKTKTGLAQHMGLGNSWVTKLLKPIAEGGLKTVTDEQASRLEDYLGIRFYVQVTERLRVSDTARKLSVKAESSSELGKVLEALDHLTEPHVSTPRFFETKEMPALGQEIIRTVFANEDKPGKVAREVLALVTMKPAEWKKRRARYEAKIREAGLRAADEGDGEVSP